jgi:hypothetical protein
MAMPSTATALVLNVMAAQLSLDAYAPLINTPGQFRVSLTTYSP